MTFEYAWLKILEVLTRAKRPLSVEELRQDLGRHGFRLEGGTMEKALERLRAEGLVEALVLADGGLESNASVAVTAKGERKVRGIIRL